MKIENYQEMPAGAYEYAIFDVDFEGKNFMPLRGFALCKSKIGHFYVKSPAFKDNRISLGKQYVPAIDLNSEKGKAFSEKILQLLQPVIDRQKPKEPSFSEQEIPF